MPRCPMCSHSVAESATAFPFCSERCRLLDLGNWLDERYQVPVDDETSHPLADEGDGGAGGPDSNPRRPHIAS